MIKIYGSKKGSAARCLWMLEEVGITYEQIELNMKEKEQKQAWYVKLNPNGKVPTLVDGEFVLWESYAINAYLAERYKPELLGSTIEERSLVNQWTYWGAFHLQKYFDITLYFHLFKVGTEEASEKAKGDVQPFLKILDTHIANREYYMVGETFTLADLNVASTINVALGAGYDLSSYPYIVTWMEKIKSRPAFLKLN